MFKSKIGQGSWGRTHTSLHVLSSTIEKPLAYQDAHFAISHFRALKHITNQIMLCHLVGDTVPPSSRWSSRFTMPEPLQDGSNKLQSGSIVSTKGPRRIQVIHKHMCDWEVFWVKRIDCQKVRVHRCDILAARFSNHHFQG